jgi:hypothetical protein
MEINNAHKLYFTSCLSICRLEENNYGERDPNFQEWVIVDIRTLLFLKTVRGNQRRISKTEIVWSLFENMCKDSGFVLSILVL